MHTNDLISTVRAIHDLMKIDCSDESLVQVISNKHKLPNLKDSIREYSRSTNHITVEINVKYLNFLTNEVYGIYQSLQLALNKYSVKILVNNKNNNFPWERYIAAKELSHILAGTEDKTWTQDIVELISEILDGKPLFHSTIPNILETEYSALIFAMELLVPICFNESLKDTRRTTTEIANTFMIPDKVIEIMRKNDYQEMREEYLSTLH